MTRRRLNADAMFSLICNGAMRRYMRPRSVASGRRVCVCSHPMAAVRRSTTPFPRKHEPTATISGNCLSCRTGTMTNALVPKQSMVPANPPCPTRKAGTNFTRYPVAASGRTGAALFQRKH
jgi:hypothetical protein